MGVYIIDTTADSTVVRCTRCPYWWAFTWSRVEGWEAAARHEIIVHPEDHRARKNLLKIQERARVDRVAS